MGVCRAINHISKEVAPNGQLFDICQMLLDGKKEADKRNREM
jgi:hypothetical protein